MLFKRSNLNMTFLVVNVHEGYVLDMVDIKNNKDNSFNIGKTHKHRYVWVIHIYRGNMYLFRFHSSIYSIFCYQFESKILYKFKSGG